MDSAAEVWSVDLSITEDAKRLCLALLTAGERERAGRFLRPQDRDRFVVSHAAWRLVIGRAVGADPKALLFGVGAAGKPELVGPEQGRLHFNLSHSGDQALIGLSTTARIGVDVEALREVPDALRIARHHFASEESRDLASRSSEDLSAAFVGLWTRKEAFVKACGLGLSLPLDSFVVSVPPRPAEMVSIGGDEEAAHGWTLHGLTPCPGYVGAVAIEGRERSLCIRSLSLDWVAELGAAIPTPGLVGDRT